MATKRVMNKTDQAVNSKKQLFIVGTIGWVIILGLLAQTVHIALRDHFNSNAGALLAVYTAAALLFVWMFIHSYKTARKNHGNRLHATWAAAQGVYFLGSVFFLTIYAMVISLFGGNKDATKG